MIRVATYSGKQGKLSGKKIPAEKNQGILKFGKKTVNCQGIIQKIGLHRNYSMFSET